MMISTMTNRVSCRYLAIATIMLVALWAPISSNGAPINETLYPRVDAMAECNKHTGWTPDHIEFAKLYNDDCSIVCVIRGKDTSYNIRQNLPCYDQEHRCFDGSCYEKKDVPASSLGDKVYAIIQIHGASVRDADPWPMQGGSDPFAVVEELIEEEGENRTEISSKLFCNTKTIQDTNTPKWSHSCKGNPIHMKSRLRFSVYDSDKPSETPDKLGSATVAVEDIADGEPHALPLGGSPGAGTTGAYIKVSINIDKTATREPAVN